jgi:hypothetical protein
MLAANLALRFVLELAALAALAYWGAVTPDNTVLKVVLAVGAPLLAALVWGAFVSPKARFVVAPHWRMLAEVLVFGAAAAALYASGQGLFGDALIVAWIANRAMLALRPPR